MWTDIKKAQEMLDLCDKQKGDVEDYIVRAERAYHNQTDVAPATGMVTQMVPVRLPITNNFGFGMRVWMTIFMGAPFAVETTPAGARDPMGLKKTISDADNHVVNMTRQTPEHKSFMRRLGTQAMLCNMVAIYDGIKRDKTPFEQIIGWRDIYIDPAACEPINEYRGPSCVAVRLWLRPDEAEVEYGAKRLKDMSKGFTGSYTVDDRTKEIYEDLYPVIHWWGFDCREETIGRGEVREAVDVLWQPIIQGQAFHVLADEPHDKVINEGDKRFIQHVNKQTGSSLDPEAEPIEPEVDSAMVQAHQVGLGFVADNYTSWRQMQVDAMKETPGGKRKKFPTGIYRCEFQEDAEDVLVGPEDSPYKHGQLPVSIACRHEGTTTYWVPGISKEALDKQDHITYIERRENLHLHFQSNAFVYALQDYLADKYRDPATGEQTLIDDLIKGNRMMMLTGVPATVDPRTLIGFITPGALSMDVEQKLRTKIAEFMELFGASDIMRGMGPGAEASGKHIQLKMEAASRPSSFMFHLLEGPVHKYYERKISNINNFAPPEWLSKICSQEQVMAIMAGRESGDMEMTIKVNLGAGMPTEWMDRMGIIQQLAVMMYPPQIAAAVICREMGIQMPSQEEMAEILAKIPPMPPDGPQGPPPGEPMQSAQQTNMPVQAGQIQRGS